MLLLLVFPDTDSLFEKKPKQPLFVIFLLSYVLIKSGLSQVFQEMAGQSNRTFYVVFGLALFVFTYN